MGAVYRATDEKLNREVAVKILHPGMLKQGNLMERFRREARMHAKMIHPNIVTLLSLYEDGEHMALVMEMVHGQNLREYLRQNPRPALPDVIRIAEAVCSGLAVAHKLGLVHRDLKPANILLAEDGSIKLMDFGLAKHQGGDDDLTQSGAAIGSFRYMSPEQILNQSVDARTDLYALGILMYQMTTGKLPFNASTKGGGEFEIMEKQVRHDPEYPHKLNPALPPAMSDLIMALLAKDPDRRPVNCEGVRKTLKAIARQIEHPQSNIVYSHTSVSLNNIEIAKGLLYSWSKRTLRFLRGAGLGIKFYMLDIPFRWVKEHLVSPRKNMKIAKRALHLWIRSISGFLSRAGLRIKSCVLDIPFRWTGANLYPLLAKRLNLPDRFQPPFVWGMIVILVGGMGWGLVGLVRMFEHASPVARMMPSAIQSPVSATPEKRISRVVKKEQPKVPQSIPGKIKTLSVEKSISDSSRASGKPVHVSKGSRMAARPITYRVAHRLVRSDGSSSHGGTHEFRGGKRVYFHQLAHYRLKHVLHSFKTGWIRLYLKKPVRLSRIVIHRASVGRRSFKGGEIKLEVQDRQGHWETLLLRKNRDIDRPLSIRKPRNILADVKGVRFKFKTSEPITVGPIDLLP